MAILGKGCVLVHVIDSVLGLHGFDGLSGSDVQRFGSFVHSTRLCQHDGIEDVYTGKAL